jgi:hypothetical protein
MGKRMDDLNWSKFSNEVCEGKRWAVYDDALAAAAADEHELRCQLAACHDSNAKLAAEVERLQQEATAMQAENDALRARCRHGE